MFKPNCSGKMIKDTDCCKCFNKNKKELNMPNRKTCKLFNYKERIKPYGSGDLTKFDKLEE